MTQEAKPEQADPEVAQLAASIVGEEVPAVIEGKDSVSPQAGTASKGSETPPGDGGKSTDSKGEEKAEGEGDDKPGEGGDTDDQEDPLKDLAADKDGALKALLEHPDLGPLLNRWLDKASDGRVATALAQAKPITEADTRKADAVRAEDKHFSGMTQEQISEEIAGDEKAAIAYAQYQERKQAEGQPDPKAVTEASLVYSYASRVAVVTDLIKESDLSTDVKETLNPDNFTHLKAEGITVWEKAVFKALVTHEAAAVAAKEIAGKKETLNEEIMAEVDGERPAIVTGRADGPSPDFMKTDSGTLLESALSKKPKKGS